MGAIGGGIWHYFKGLRNAPKGERLRGGVSSVKARAPIVGGVFADPHDCFIRQINLIRLCDAPGAFAVWGLCFASFDCSIAAIRKKEDPWNAILSGACTGGLLAIRGESTAHAYSGGGLA